MQLIVSRRSRRFSQTDIARTLNTSEGGCRERGAGERGAFLPRSSSETKRAEICQPRPAEGLQSFGRAFMLKFKVLGFLGGRFISAIILSIFIIRVPFAAITKRPGTAVTTLYRNFSLSKKVTGFILFLYFQH